MNQLMKLPNKIDLMKVFNYIVITAALLIAGVNHVNAREWLGPKSDETHDKVKSKSAGCSPATTITEFYVNNVRTSAETGGNTWFDRPNGLPYYEVPAEELNHAIFAGSLWMGGLDPAGNLKLAAIRFRQRGSDYWPGPLTIDGTASTIRETCAKWDRFFLMSRRMVERHRYFFTLVNQGEDPFADPVFEDGYAIPQEILNWPAHGDVSLGQSPLLAPFADLRDPETLEILTTPDLYEPEQGDYPLYDLEQEIDCRTRLVTDPVPLFGDFTMYWIFNDNGNIHTESQGEPIGMEIQGQMFGFNTNDEINNMTFCNYVLINRGSLTLNDTFFAQWVDTDLGNPFDDYVGCDVVRGLGYSYNGNDFDEGSSSGPGYGAQPPAIGIDFFEGPYQDADGINNLVGIGENQALNGLGYLDPSLPEELQDTIIDNERFGMRRFVYHSNVGQGAPPPTTDPVIAVEYYNMMRGIWKDGTPMTVGGLGYNPQNPNAIPTDFMFPGTSDPLHWGTEGVDPNYPDPRGWTEEAEDNPPGDRRFVQSAGPFTLSPGQFNNITVGVVYARAPSGGPFASVVALLGVDDKAQALFDNCFRLLDGPDSPDVTFQELDREIILYLRNTNPLSNNQNEEYTELDPTIPPFNVDEEPNDQFYRFQGYQVYQLRGSDVSVSDIDDPAVSRLVFQCDIRDDIVQIINYEFDQELGLPVPREMVNGANEGIRHSIRIRNDRFASGDTRLVNFKQYFFVAVAYGHNEYEPYNPDPDRLSGQAFPYIRSRKSATGEVSPVRVVPHKPDPRENGTVQNAEFGDGIPITRIEGRGNGDYSIRPASESVEEIIEGPIYKADHVTYQPGHGPINVKVVDPLNIQDANFELRFFSETVDSEGNFTGSMNDSQWILIDTDSPSGDTIVFSEQSIQRENEQILPEYGISVTIGRATFERGGSLPGAARTVPRLLSTERVYKSGPRNWLTGVADASGAVLANWIRSGTVGEDQEDSNAPCFLLPDGSIDPWLFNDYTAVDENREYDNIFGGIIAPARLASWYDCGPAPLSGEANTRLRQAHANLRNLTSLHLAFTPDKSKWSRCVVLEMATNTAFSQGGAEKFRPRMALSVDKNGRNQFDPGVNLDEATYFGQQVITAEYLSSLSSAAVDAIINGLKLSYPQIQSQDDLIGLSVGMGWFPGYALNPETGERYNVMFGENSTLLGENGRDMLWNPTGTINAPGFGQNPFWGGEHYIYVQRNDADNPPSLPGGTVAFQPMYDGGQFNYETFNDPFPVPLRAVFSSLNWVMIPILDETNASWNSVEDGLVPGELDINIAISRNYARFATAVEQLGEDAVPWVNPSTPENIALSTNQWYPTYRFSTSGLATTKQDRSTAENALDMIDIVPNPYYAYSAYEQSRVENRVRMVNLPPECKIQIFTLNGTLIRILEKDNNLTYLDWDLQNEQFIPIAGGMYLIHVQSPGLGERVLKFFCATRPTDLRNF